MQLYFQLDYQPQFYKAEVLLDKSALLTKL